MNAAAETTWLERSTAMCERLGSRIQPSFCRRYRSGNASCHKCPQVDEMDRLAADLDKGESVTVPMGSEDEPMTSKAAKICKDCGQEKKIIGRGLCGTCYHRHKDAGTLEELFPKLGRFPSKDTKEEATASVDEVACHEDEKGTSPDRDVTAGETAQDHEVVDLPHTLGPYEQLVDDYKDVDYSKAEPRPRFPVKACFTTRDGVDVVRIEFLERDRDLLAYLESWAKEERRSLADQILFVLDNIVFERNQESASLVVADEGSHV